LLPCTLPTDASAVSSLIAATLLAKVSIVMEIRQCLDKTRKRHLNLGIRREGKTQT